MGTSAHRRWLEKRSTSCLVELKPQRSTVIMVNPQLSFWGVEPADFTMEDLPPDYRNSSAAHGYVDEMRALIDWVRKDVDPVNAAKVKDGLRATTIGIKAIESIHTGQPQHL